MYVSEARVKYYIHVLCKYVYSLEMRVYRGKKGEREKKKMTEERGGEREGRERETEYTHIETHNSSHYTCYCVFYMLRTCKRQVERKYV